MTIEDKENKPTEKSFLSLLESLRWIILKYTTVLRWLNNRIHFICDHMKDVFESLSFIDYQTNILLHLESSNTNDPNIACIDSVLSGVISCLASINRGVNTLSQIFKDYKQSRINQIENVLHTQDQNGINEVCTIIGSFPNRNDSITSSAEGNVRQIMQETNTEILLLTNNGGNKQLRNVHDVVLAVPKTNAIQSVLEKNGT